MIFFSQPKWLKPQLTRSLVSQTDQVNHMTCRSHHTHIHTLTPQQQQHMYEDVGRQSTLSQYPAGTAHLHSTLHYSSQLAQLLCSHVAGAFDDWLPLCLQRHPCLQRHTQPEMAFFGCFVGSHACTRHSMVLLVEGEDVGGPIPLCVAQWMA